MLLLGLRHPYMVNKVRYSDAKSHGVFKSMSSLCGIPVNTKHVNNICAMLDLGPRRWTDVVQTLCKCVVSAGISSGACGSYTVI